MTPEEKKIRKRADTRITQSLIALVGVLIAISFNFWYTAHSQDQNDKRWCALMVSLDNRYQALPQDANADAKVFAAQIHVLRQDFHCPKGTTP